MLADYGVDHLVEYGVEQIDLEKKVINPAYRKITYQIKKEREKQQRLKAKLLNNVTLNKTAQLDEIKTRLEIKASLLAQIEIKQKTIIELVEKKAAIPAKIKLSQMPEESRITKLKTESAYFMSTLKMICYRAETSTANLLYDVYGRYEEEKRMFIKNIISTAADLVPYKINNILTVRLLSLNTPKANELMAQICKILNETETIFPGTNLRLIYENVVS